MPQGDKQVETQTRCEADIETGATSRCRAYEGRADKARSAVAPDVLQGARPERAGLSQPRPAQSARKQEAPSIRYLDFV